VLTKTSSTTARIASIAAASIVWFLSDGSIASSQVKSLAGKATQMQVTPVPSPAYFVALEMYQTGQFREAAAALSALVQPPNPRWRSSYRWSLSGLSDPLFFRGRAAAAVAATQPVDDICYFTMLGECNYQLGNYPLALLDYQAALALHLSNLNWVQTITMPRAMQALVTPPIPWGQRGTAPGDFPATVTVGGRLAFPTRFANAQLNSRFPTKTIYVQEIVRCTCLAIYRWHELVGPLGEYHPFRAALLKEIRRRPGPAKLNPWAEVWRQVESGMIAALEGDPADAIPKLEQAALFGGLDHPLTGYALLMLGRLSAKPDVAENYFVQASLAAGHYGDVTVVQEALRSATELHLSGGPTTKFAPLEPAIVWSATAGSKPLEATLLLLAAENDYQLGQIESATARLAAASALVTGTEMATGRIGARLAYLDALVAYRGGNTQVGETALQASLAYQRLGSFWQFRAGMIELACFAELVPDHRAAGLYTDLFSGPRQADWLSDPLESLSSLVIPHAPSLERWLELPMVARQAKLAFEIAERTRRHRFLSTLDLGGRALALRWVLEAPEARLNDAALAERPQILVRAPQYADLSSRSRELIAELRKLPVSPEKQEEVKRQKKLLEELQAKTAQQEIILRQLALERQDCELVFPPLKSPQQVQAELAEGQAILSFLETSQHVHAFLLTKQDVIAWQLELSPQQVAARLRDLLEHWGNHTANSPLTHRDLEDDRWRESAQRLFVNLTSGSKVEFSNIKELIVVPDGELWYLPFEALLMPDDSTQPLAARMRVRYSPTAGLAVGDTRKRRFGRTVIMPDRAQSPDQKHAEAEHLSQFSDAVPDAEVLHGRLPSELTLLAPCVDQLVVEHEIHVTGDPYQWSPMPGDGKHPSGTLADWLALPWGGPDQVVLLGFHTPAERPAKSASANQVPPANELFLSLCGLMAAGPRTVFISRWRTHGQTNYDLMREFVRELPHATASEAWQRAMLAVTGKPLSPEKEPRLKKEHGAEVPSAAHPFFWAGLMLTDTGSPSADGEP
jgi:CHAT domain-containing protein